MTNNSSPSNRNRRQPAPGSTDDPAEWHHETAYLNNIAVHYVTVTPNLDAVDHPTGAAPLVVLLHGFPEHWYTWHHQLSSLANAGYRVVAPDLRGYNRSSAPAGVESYRTAELVADVRGLVHHHGSSRATLIGHDIGGLIAWETAIREPELVDQLAILNAPHPDLYRRHLGRSPTQLFRSLYVFAAQLPWVPERILEADGYRVVAETLTHLPGTEAFTETDIRRFRAAMEQSESPAGPLNYYRAVGRDTVETGLRMLLGREEQTQRAVDVPTLVFWGEHDPALEVTLLDGLHRLVPDLQVSRLPETGHWPHIEHPQRVTDEIRSFLANAQTGG
ncbi:alpha/beta fold hydrolase [Halovenus rubra]|uniref:Alpha/beta fold hydrolase n=2 Tax=Halovenus rubra TaxID=869890 RepID=A0ABD5XG67_9EURY|nr:alpha/beta hydrolase [Halovenus rubra]